MPELDAGAVAAATVLAFLASGAYYAALLVVGVIVTAWP